MVHLPEILVVSILHHSSIPSAISSFTLLSSPVWALTESHALVEAASLEFNTFFWCCRLGSHDRPVPSPLTQLSFQPCWYNCGEMCENTGKGLWQKNSNSFYQHYNQIIHKKKNIFTYVPTAQKILINASNHKLPTFHTRNPKNSLLS